jgi:hypothetical protein
MTGLLGIPRTRWHPAFARVIKRLGELSENMLKNGSYFGSASSGDSEKVVNVIRNMEPLPSRLSA